MTLKLAPFVLACLIFEPSLFVRSRSEGMEKDWLSIRAHQIIFGVLEAMEESKKPIDIVTLSTELGPSALSEVGGASYLVEVSNASSTSAHFTYNLGILRGLKARRDLVSSMTNRVGEAQDVMEEPAEVLTRLTEAVEMARHTLSPPKSFLTSGEACKAFLMRLEERANSEGETPGNATGLRSLDAVTGGLRKRELWVVAGPTSGGKSVLSIQAACQVAKTGGRVIIFSMEMGGDEVFGRMCACYGEVPMGAITGSDQATKSDLRKLSSACEDIAKFTLAISDESGMTLDLIKAHCARFADEGDIDLIVIDYIQLIDCGNRQGESREQELSRASRDLKKLAKKYDCPLITPSQLNDDGRLRESRAIGQDADVVLKIDPTEGIVVDKNRNGPRGGTLPLYLNGELQRFEHR